MLAASASSSKNGWLRAPDIETIAVMRIWPALRNATTDPSMASHRNRKDASSSDQTIGLLTALPEVLDGDDRGREGSGVDGADERVKCEGREGFVHIMLDA